MTALSLFSVFLGGGVGALCRFLLTESLMQSAWGRPLATALINVVGSFAAGAVVSWFARQPGEHAPLLLFLTVGVLGGFTTFSAFSMDVISYAQTGDWRNALLCTAGTVTLSLVAAAAGVFSARVLLT